MGGWWGGPGNVSPGDTSCCCCWEEEEEEEEGEGREREGGCHAWVGKKECKDACEEMRWVEMEGGVRTREVCWAEVGGGKAFPSIEEEKRKGGPVRSGRTRNEATRRVLYYVIWGENVRS